MKKIIYLKVQSYVWAPEGLLHLHLGSLHWRGITARVRHICWCHHKKHCCLTSLILPATSSVSISYKVSRKGY